MTIPPALIDIPKLLESVGSLLWPLIVMFFLLAFRPAVAAIIASARSRKFTLKIGGQELTMEEANEQHEKLIADLQSQVLEIRKSLEAQSASPLRAQTPAAEAARLSIIYAATPAIQRIPQRDKRRLFSGWTTIRRTTATLSSA